MFAQLAHFVGLDRSQLDGLVLSAVEAMVTDSQLPAFVLLDGQGVLTMPPIEVHPKHTLRCWRDGVDAKNLVMIRELTMADVRRFSDEQIVEALLLCQFIADRPLVRTSIAVALSEIGGRVRGPVESEIARRRSDDQSLA